MDKYLATEIAYQNGYKQGLKDAVRLGRWIDTGFFTSHKIPIYACSLCFNEVYDSYIDCHKYCLHCGAKMNGED